jgi:hypothetical protein
MDTTQLPWSMFQQVHKRKVCGLDKLWKLFDSTALQVCLHAVCWCLE